MLAREAPVSAVSLAAKKPETSRQKITMVKPSQSMNHSGFCFSAVEPRLTP